MAKKIIAKVAVPAELNKALVLFIAGVVAVVASRLISEFAGDLLALVGLVLFLGAFYLVLKWSGLWDKLKNLK